MAEASAAHKSNYMRIFVYLAVLTAVEVGIAFTALPKSAQVPVLVALAVAKATLVALHYMHLRSEETVLRIIAVVPLLLTVLVALFPVLDLVVGR